MIKSLRKPRVRLSGSGYSNLYRAGQLKQKKKPKPKSTRWVTVQPEKKEGPPNA